jgi:hypothetical protein
MPPERFSGAEPAEDAEVKLAGDGAIEEGARIRQQRSKLRLLRAGEELEVVEKVRK